MIVLDTTILVYALGAEHPLREPARALVELVRDGTVRATTTVEVVQEFVHVRARRRSGAEAGALGRDYAVGLAPLAHPEQEELLEGLELYSRSEELGAFDAVLAATARRRGWALASADRSFDRVDGLLHLDLSSPTFLDTVRLAG